MARGRTLTRSTAGSDTYVMEHSLAYIMAAIAIILGIIGMLRGFGVIGGNDASNTVNGNMSALWDGVMWMLPAISAALLSWALHDNDHHRMRDTEHLSDADEGMWKGEHSAAYITALLSIVFAILGMLVGFHLLGRDDHQVDSIPWHLASIGLAILTNALHNVRHHQLAGENGYIVTHHIEDRTAGDPLPRSSSYGDRPTVRR